jgi:hypothetical protein
VDRVVVEEVTLDALRTRFTENAHKRGIPGTMLAALAVVDRVNPSAVRIEQWAGNLMLTGQQDGLAFAVTLPVEEG